MHRTQKMFSNRAKFNHFLQTLSVTLLHVVQFSGATHIPSIIILYQLFFYTPLWPFVLLYLSWTYLAEWKTPERGGRDLLRNFMRRLPIFKFMRDYYPITLVKTRDLDPQMNYIFGYHPHGVFTEGASIGLNTEACGFSEKFPGIIPHLSVTSGTLKYLNRHCWRFIGFRFVSLCMKFSHYHPTIIIYESVMHSAVCRTPSCDPKYILYNFYTRHEA